MTNRRRKVRKNYNKYHSIYHRHRRLNVKRIVISVGTLIVLGVLMVIGITTLVSNNKSVKVVQNNIELPTKVADKKVKNTVKNAAQNIKPTEVSIVEVGDNLVSDSVLYTAKRYGGGKYDFS